MMAQLKQLCCNLYPVLVCSCNLFSPLPNRLGLAGRGTSPIDSLRRRAAGSSFDGSTYPISSGSVAGRPDPSVSLAGSASGLFRCSLVPRRHRLHAAASLSRRASSSPPLSLGSMSPPAPASSLSSSPGHGHAVLKSSPCTSMGARAAAPPARAVDPPMRHAVGNKAIKAMPSICASFQPKFPRTIIQATQREKHNVPCYQRQEALQIEARSMVEVYDALAERLFSVLKNIEHLDSKYIVGLAGPPGAGKSTVASEVVRLVNIRWSQMYAKNNSLNSTEEIATMLPMDGFHLYRFQLDSLEDPKEAHARRGAPWTFNPSLFLKCLQTLRKEGSVYAPSFDHGVGDPVENDIFVKPQHKIVIVEGNYLLMEEDIWRDVRDVFDEKWFIDVDIDVSMQRVLKRHIATGKEPDVAAWRISYNDRPNAELIMRSIEAADIVIRSVDI